MDPIAVTYIPIDYLRPDPRNAHTHPKRQIKQLKGSISEHGFVNPILCDEHYGVIAGHGRLMATKELGYTSVPVIILRGLSDVQKRKLMLADNRIPQNAGWDYELVAAELSALLKIDGMDLSTAGFDPAVVDQILADHEANSADPADNHQDPPAHPVSKRGDVWIAGRHRLLCGDARDPADLENLLGPDRAAMAFLDPPYNVQVAGIVGRGQITHDEFAMASGEMDQSEFQSFLTQALGNAAAFSRDGAVHFVSMDWRHIEDLMAIARAVYGQVLNLIAWVKSNAGQGSFYRSRHELIGVFRVGSAANLNNIELGRHGRNRSNVWEYAGVNAFGKGRLDDLGSHPTVKPVAMIADAIKDCTRRGDIVLDTFAGSGTTMLACERVGRQARSIEYEPKYVDVAIRRWQAFSGRDVVHAETGCIFDEMPAASDKEVA